MNVYDTIMASPDELMANAKGEADTLTRHTLIVDESAGMASTEQKRVDIDASQMTDAQLHAKLQQD